MHHEKSYRVLVQYIGHKFKPVGFESAGDCGIAELPEFRIPSSTFPVQQSNPKFRVSFAISEPLNNNILRLKVTVGENRTVAAQSAINHLSQQLDILV